MTRPAAGKTFDIFILILFGLALAAPLIGSIYFRDKEVSASEKRELAKFPKFPDSFRELTLFFQDFERYYADHFGFREFLIYRYHREMEKRFRVTGTPLVLRGEKKWLFFTGDNLLADFQGRQPLTEEQLEEFSNIQQKRKHWLEQRDIQFLSFTAPNKQTVYPEHMPQMYRQARGTTRLQQFHQYLSESPLPLYVNVHDALVQAKGRHKLYFALDSHWNQYGAYVAFRELVTKMAQLFPENRFTVDFPFYKDPQISVGGDLAKILMVEKISAEIVPMLLPRTWCGKEYDVRLNLARAAETRHEQVLFKGCREAGLKAVMFGDSFLWQIEPYLSENFAQILYLQKEFDRETIGEILKVFKPDIVIEELAERNYFKVLEH